MKRTLLMTFAVASSIVVLAQLGALLYFSATGALTKESLWELQAVFEDSKSPSSEGGASDADQPEFSIEELMRERVVRTFDLEDREREMDVFAQMLITNRDKVLQDKQDLVSRQTLFIKELEAMKEKETAEATLLAQGVLLAVPPQDAVRDLMQLSLEENITLIKGMPVKSIGKILKEFHQGDDLLKRRGAEIFAALAIGNPAAQMIQDEIQQFK